jgi:hypothetical protein
MHDTKQIYYNQVKGQISQILNIENFPSIVLQCGHDRKRDVNICFKPILMSEIVEKYEIGDNISIKFFISSRLKHGRWYTMCNGLEVIT